MFINLEINLFQFTLDELTAQISIPNEKSPDITLPIIRIRLLNYEPIVHLKDLAANTYGMHFLYYT